MDYASYADDTTQYVCRQNYELLEQFIIYARTVEFLEPAINNMFAWFKHDGHVANSGKSDFLGSPYEKISLKILDSTVESSPYKDLSGITSDGELTFQKHDIIFQSQ